MLGRLAVGVVFLVTFVVNPNLACSSDPDAHADFDYSESEMEHAVVGTYVGTVEDSGEEITLVIRRARAVEGASGATSVRLQCGSRSFVAPAGACDTVSQMALEADITSSEGRFDAVLFGTILAGGTLEHATLYLSGEGDKGGTVSGDLVGGKLEHFRIQRGNDPVMEVNLERQ